MEEMRRAAIAYYTNLTQHQKDNVMNLFNRLDKDGDRTISIGEFKRFLCSVDVQDCNYSSLFKVLDRDGSGGLDYQGVITFFYMICCNRFLLCDGCGKFLEGVYFTCSQCFHPTNSFDLCTNCFRINNFKHHSDAIFYDNYALLRSGGFDSQKISSFSSQASSQARGRTFLSREMTSSSSSSLVLSQNKSSSGKDKWERANKKLGTTYEVIKVASDILEVGIASGCIIM